MTIECRWIYFGVIVISLIIILQSLTTYYKRRKSITNYFIVIKSKKKGKYIYKVCQSLNCAGKKEVSKLKKDMANLRIRAKMKEIDNLFSKQIRLLLIKLAENNYIELEVRTHLGRKLKQAQKSGYIDYLEEINGDLYSEIIEKVFRNRGNIKRKNKGLSKKSNGRPLLELKMFLKKKDFNVALVCGNKSKPYKKCCNCCKKEDCVNLLKSKCYEYVWKNFKTYKIKLNIQNILNELN